MAFTRPSSLKPMLYEEAAEFVDEAYRGIGAVYDHDVGSGRLSWDAYAGRLVESGLGEHRYQALVGGRVTYQTPVDGLRAMLSVNRTGATQVESGASGRYTTWLGSVDYTRGALDLKAEYATKTGLGVTGDAWYGQAAYTFAERWTPYVRYDSLTTDRARSHLPSYHQESLVLGIGFRLNDYVAFRLETHRNDGYAVAVAARDIAEGGIGPESHYLRPASINDLPKGSKAIRAEIVADEMGDGWAGDSVERSWVEAMANFVSDKILSVQASGYTRFDRTWLVIYDNWPAPNLNHAKALPLLIAELAKLATWSTFERVFILDESVLLEVEQGMVYVYCVNHC